MSKKNDFKVDFIGVGAPRCGTTWLTTCLSEHPEIYIPSIKEVGFFYRDKDLGNYHKGLEWYKSFFKKRTNEKVIGEFTTHYMYRKDAHKLIKKHFPDTKIIICLRNPEDMVYSLYWWKKSTFKYQEIPETIEDAIEEENFMVDQGNYYKYLKHYFQIFDHKKIHVVFFDDIKNKPKKVVRDIYKFLGVKSSFTPSVVNRVVNEAVEKRSTFLSSFAKYLAIFLKSFKLNDFARDLVRKKGIWELYLRVFKKSFKYPPLHDFTRYRLRKLYEKDIEKLEKLLGKNLSSWKPQKCQEKSKIIDFIGIGAAKSGTTWYSRCLEEHPLISFSSEVSRKELSFFNSHSNWQGEGDFDLSTWDKGIDWYLTQFPEPAEGKVRGEFTVSYLIDKYAYKRIKRYFPDTKILVVLRNPVDMIYSLHNFGSAGALADVPSDFHEAIRKGYNIKFGFYYKFLKRYYELFPRKNIHVTLVDDMKRDPLKTIQKVYKFLGVDDKYVPPSLNTHVNVAFKPRSGFVKHLVHRTLRFARKVSKPLYYWILDNDSLYRIYATLNKKDHVYPPLDLSTREDLKRVFLEDIENLEKLIKRDLSSWK